MVSSVRQTQNSMDYKTTWNFLIYIYNLYIYIYITSSHEPIRYYTFLNPIQTFTTVKLTVGQNKKRKKNRHFSSYFLSRCIYTFLSRRHGEIACQEEKRYSLLSEKCIISNDKKKYIWRNRNIIQRYIK